MTSPVHHETSDVSLSAVFAFGIGLTISGVVISVLVWGVFVFFSGSATRRGATGDRRTATHQPRLPPEPRLQTDPRGDLGALREADERVLTTYGWVDRKAGVVRIPIEQAMTLTVERGLPSRPAKEPAR
jgi:hypothetical protein